MKQHLQNEHAELLKRFAKMREEFNRVANLGQHENASIAAMSMADVLQELHDNELQQEAWQ